MATDGNIKLGWDNPLEVDWNLEIDVLRREIRNLAPVKSGALRQAFDDKQSVRFINKEKTRILISVSKGSQAAPYAAAVNFGSGLHGPRGAKYRIPRIGNTTAKVLRFFSQRFGKIVFRKYVMHPGQVGKHFVERGVAAWWKKLTGQQYNIVKWKGGAAGQSFGGRRGVVSAPDL